MSKRKLGIFVVAIMVIGALVPALLVPSLVEAETIHYGYMVYTPNHPYGCAPLPYDCYVIFVWPDTP